MNNQINMNSMKNKKEDACLKSVKVGSRGQIVIPLELRKKFDIKEGEILFVCENESRIEIIKSEILKKALDNMEDKND